MHGAAATFGWFFFLIVPSRASFACSAGVDRHQAGAGRPARRAQELGPGLRRPLQLGHDHLLPAEPRHRPVSSRPSPSSSRARGRRDETSRAVRRELVVMAGARRASSSANLIVFAFQGSAEPGLVGDSVREDRQPHAPRASVSNHPRATNPSIRPSVRLCGSCSLLTRFAPVVFRLLQNNNITGRLPPELGALPRLQTLDLSNNRFSGRVPNTLGRITTLRYL